ncbi:MAG: hypothetical protein ACRDV9_05930 [Acidimicrobiia bacterium]
MLTASTTGCGQSTPEPSGEAAGFPVAIDSCGPDVTFTEPPTRAAATDVNMAEMMLALDLGAAPTKVFVYDSGEAASTSLPMRRRAGTTTPGRTWSRASPSASS